MKVLIILLALVSMTLGQSNLYTKPDKVIHLHWSSSSSPNVTEYAIFWCQGADTTLFPFKDGTDPDSLWMNEPINNWSFARTYGLEFGYFPHNMSGTTYVRLGVAAIDLYTGKMGLIKCINKVVTIKRPTKLIEVWAE